MHSRNLILSSAIFVKLFPFHFVVDRDLAIVQVGETLHKILAETVVPESFIHQSFNQLFHLRYPEVSATFEDLQQADGSIFWMEVCYSTLELKGEMTYDPQQQLIFFLVSPWLTDLFEPDLFTQPQALSPCHMSLDFLNLVAKKKRDLCKAIALNESLEQQRNRLLQELARQEKLGLFRKKYA